MTLQVTDAGAQAWSNGSFEFRLTPNVQYPNLGGYTWTGGTLLQSITGSLNGSGTATPSIPSNSAITPVGSTWVIKACPQATAACFFSVATIITGATQTVTLTPPAIAITLSNPPGAFTLAYADSEIVSTPLGGQYYNLTSNATRTCTAVTGTTCTTWTSGSSGGVTSFNTRTGAVVPAANDYTLDQIGNPAASKTFSLGSNPLGWTSPGVFTNLAMNENFLATTTGGGACNTANILALGGVPGVFLTDGIATCVNLPTTGVTNGFTNGFASYMHNSNANNAGFFGWTGAVGYYDQMWCDGGSASNTKCWGANFSVADAATKPATLFGNEYDFTVNNATTSGFGNLFSMRGTAQPALDTFPMILAQTASGTARFTSGFETAAGSLASGATNAYAAVNIGPQESGVNQDSAFMYFTANNGAPIISAMHLSQDNYMYFGSKAFVMQTSPSAGNPGGWGISLRSAAAALSVNQLVKIDTGNNDAVVVCTTTDTLCNGFVQGTSVSCPSNGSFCGLITVPGSRSVGILGTGTCAIGNFVIVDTTTNGDVKCTATQPINGMWEGYALSAQSTVGQLVDVFFFPTRLQSLTAPTIAAAGCGGSAASIVVSNGPSAFKINVGTAPTSACTVTLPTATTGWNCFATDITTNSTSVFLQKQTGAESTTQATVTNFSDVAVATAFVASDILKVSCSAD